MFDFLLSEAFWVNPTTIAALIGAAAVIAAAIITTFIGVRKLDKTIALLNAAVESNQTALTKDISTSKDILSREHAPIACAVDFLRNEKTKEIGARDEARKSAFDVQKVVDALFAQEERLLQATEKTAVLQAEVAQLTAENAALRKELAQSRDPARDAWQEQTDEYDLEP